MTGRNRGRIFWSALGAAWLIGFVNYEAWALTHDNAITLSRFMFEISYAWSPLVFLLGLTVGILAQHFWGHIDAGWMVAVDPAARGALLAIAWALVIVLTPGGAAIFLAGLPLGQLVTRLWWPWNPLDQEDHRG